MTTLEKWAAWVGLAAAVLTLLVVLKRGKVVG